ncbi:DUF3152 domain-containing protein [Demequina flava]|uniref:DUF3152 domain-containing protein n=1 Tax=Demequina flava TaxID=1095025 RepID=UPI0013648915|nr:DUF3152 domain-containing protein [Demequina flava]
MSERERGLFAGRGIHLPSWKAIIVTVAITFVAGLAVGWGTSLVGGNLATVEPSLSPSATPEPSPTVDVSLPPLEPIDRELDEDDINAGLTSLAIPERLDGMYTTVTADAEPTGDAQAIRYVRVDYETGLGINDLALASYVLDVLNDPRGWGANGRYEYVPTAGVADIRVALASPYTATLTCPNPHAPASLGVQADPTATPSASAEASADASPESSPSPSSSASASPSVSAEQEGTCADRGLIMISAYDWAAGLDSYGDERNESREYSVSHGVGHVLGEEDGICASGRALLMTNQEELPDECTPNPWPYPDEPVPEPSPTPEPSVSPSADE